MEEKIYQKPENSDQMECVRGIMFSTNMEFCLTNFAYWYCENDNKITNIKIYQ